MSVLRDLLGVLIGKTVAVPLGVALVVVVGLVLHAVAPRLWSDVGAPLLVVGVAVVLTVALDLRGR